jgi:porin
VLKAKIKILCLVLSAGTAVLAGSDVSEWLTTEAALTLETYSVLDGGLKRETGLLGNLDLTAEIDTGKAGLWENGRFFFYVLGNFGDNPSEAVGDIQATSNIEAPETLKLYEAWYEHFFFGEQFTLLGGLHDYNSEFDALEYASLFLNSSFGISPDISQVGPSIFPAPR